MRRRLSRLSAAATLAVIAATAGVAPDARGHGGDASVRAVLDPLPDALDGMRVEVHETIAPQLVLENRTSRTVEVLDDEGVAFLRIGPRGVEGNVGARAWYQTQGPGSAVPPLAQRGGAPRWRRVGAEPSYGWFDPRVDRHGVRAPHELAEGAARAKVGTWAVPLRVDGAIVRLTGRFVHVAQPGGAYVVRLASPALIAPGVRVRLLPGRNPGLLVSNATERPVAVLDERGEPFLRITRAGVDADTRSVTWRRSGRAGSAGRAADGDDARRTRWTRVAHTGRYGWIDPRLAPPGPPSGGVDGAPVPWRIPLELGDQRVLVTGTLAWRSRGAAAASD